MGRLALSSPSLRRPGTAAHEAATHRREHLWRMLADVGIGQILHDGNGQRYMHKYDRSALTSSTIRWLQENRVPSYMSRIALVTDVGLVSSKEVPLRGTNPAVTIRATTADAPGPAQSSSTASQREAPPSSQAVLASASSQPKACTPEVLRSWTVSSWSPKPAERF